MLLFSRVQKEDGCLHKTYNPVPQRKILPFSKWIIDCWSEILFLSWTMLHSGHSPTANSECVSFLCFPADHVFLVNFTYAFMQGDFQPLAFMCWLLLVDFKAHRRITILGTSWQHWEEILTLASTTLLGFAVISK